MGDTAEGSPSAAQCAQDDQIPPKKGVLRRVAGFLGGNDAAVSEQSDTPDPGPELADVDGAPRGMANLRHLRVEDVAIPRVEIVSVPVDIALDELIQAFRESGNTRLPVFDGTLDNPLGLVHLKDVALRHGFNGCREDDFDLGLMLRPLIFAPPSMPIGVLLQKMQADRRHMALVIDEYGGVDGLVTIEDLIEQVIGEIEDEHDIEEEEFWVQERPGSYLALARAPLEEFEAEIGLKLVEAEDEEEVDTLGGLLFMEIGRVPVRGEVIPHSSGAQFEVIDADPRRIKRLRVQLPGAVQSGSVAAMPGPLRAAAE
ncbi:transporter associated domain-containing protein [Tropicimonas sp. TH_r6]|uniref:transporter associated domain-containing protein n=1 Tax=Tropicimonas sp. TH_r6 TaxID=3082085 RepID=UPI0029536727|nr:transporter associated domain-containing protein [Tropicimonas sp. TH_r6]MDV7145751.1 transporter associated domain-containing protein [Tropicimonas sp. TH_r6]